MLLAKLVEFWDEKLSSLVESSKLISETSGVSEKKNFYKWFYEKYFRPRPF